MSDQPKDAAETASTVPTPHQQDSATAVGCALVPAAMAVGEPAALAPAAVAAAAHGGVAAPAAAVALGLVRVKVVALIAALLRAGDAAADEAIVQAEVLPLLLELFVRYPFHNVLHHHVTEAITACLQRRTPLLCNHLLVKLAHWLVFVRVEVIPGHSHGPAGHRHGPLRAGYMGHVIRIARVLLEIIGCPVCVGGRVGLVEEEVERQDVERWKPANDAPAAQQQEEEHQQQEEEDQQQEEEKQQQQEEEQQQQQQQEEEQQQQQQQQEKQQQQPQEEQQQQQQHPLPQDQHQQPGGGRAGTAHAALGGLPVGMQHKRNKQQDGRAAEHDALASPDQDAIVQRVPTAQGAPVEQ